MRNIDVTIRIGIDQIAEIEESNLEVEFTMDRSTDVGQCMSKIIGITIKEEIWDVMWECIKITILEDRITEVDIEETIGMKIMKEVRVGLEKGHIQVTSEGMTDVVVIVGQGHDQECVLIDRIKHHRGREYDHFAKECLKTNEERETDQTQQMFNLDEEQTALKMLATDTYDSLSWVSSLEEIKSEHIKL